MVKVYEIDFSFGYLWPTIVWILSLVGNLWYLRVNKRNLVVVALLTIIPLVIGFIVGRYYETRAIGIITGFIPS